MGVTKHLCHHILSYPRYIICHTVLLLIRPCPSQHLEHSPSCPPGIYLKRWCSVCLVCLLSVCVWFWRSCTAVIKLTLCQCHLQQMGKWISLHWSTKGGSSYRNSCSWVLPSAVILLRPELAALHFLKVVKVVSPALNYALCCDPTYIQPTFLHYSNAVLPFSSLPFLSAVSQCVSALGCGPHYEYAIEDFCLGKFRLDMQELDQRHWCNWEDTVEWVG